VRRLAPLALLAILAGCAARLPGGRQPRVTLVQVDDARVRVVHWPEDQAAAAQVERALRVAIPRVARWGGLRAPVTLTIHPSHEALEAAIRRDDYPWLRAWARYATIDLQSPSSWGLLGASDRKVEELLAHELTHCVMYQQAATEWTWSYKGIPLWFREGMASVTAGQGYRRLGVEALWRFYERGLAGAGDGEPGAVARAARGRRGLADPLADPEPLYQGDSEVVYGAAHHAFQFLLDRYGEETVRRVVARMRAGQVFDRAFREAVGIDDARFAAEFRRYLLWQGWRRERR
jgi:hypothetical protein